MAAVIQANSGTLKIGDDLFSIDYEGEQILKIGKTLWVGLGDVRGNMTECIEIRNSP